MKILVQYIAATGSLLIMSICVNSCAGSTNTKTTKTEGEAIVQVASNSGSEKMTEKEKAPIQQQFGGCKAHR